MKVEDITIYWKHLNGGNTTQCFAERENVIVASSEVTKHHLDTPNRKVAMKASLEKLLQHALFGYEFRKKAWETFRTMPKVPRWGKPVLNVDQIYNEAKENYGETLKKLSEPEATESANTEKLSGAEITKTD
jgi:hypothetical protein